VPVLGEESNIAGRRIAACKAREISTSPLERRMSRFDSAAFASAAVSADEPRKNLMKEFEADAMISC